MKILTVACVAFALSACGGGVEPAGALSRSTAALTEKAEAIEVAEQSAEEAKDERRDEPTEADDAAIKDVLASYKLTDEDIADIERKADAEDAEVAVAEPGLQTEGRFRRCALQEGAPTCAAYWLAGQLKKRYH